MLRQITKEERAAKARSFTSQGWIGIVVSFFLTAVCYCGTSGVGGAVLEGVRNASLAMIVAMFLGSLIYRLYPTESIINQNREVD